MSNDNLDFRGIIDKLNNKYNKAVVHDFINHEDGRVSMVISGDRSNLDEALSGLRRPQVNDLPIITKQDAHKLVTSRYRASASVIRRDALSTDYLDLPRTPSIIKATPHDLYARSVEYYRMSDVYGSSIDLLTNFASKGFKNEIDDDNIGDFYDNWVIDTGFDTAVDKIFFEFFRSGFVRTYKAVGKYMPKINYVSPIPGQEVKKVSKETAEKVLKRIKEAKKADETAAKKHKWSKDYIPIKYTILNPVDIEIEKSSLLMDQHFVVLKAKALEGVKKLLETPQSELTENQKLLIKSMPPEMVKAAKEGKDLPLDPYLVGAVDYRRQPYEMYPYPRGSRAFESMEYKTALRQADYSTLDGITNFVLVVTIGNDDYPVRSQEQLEAVAELFNTPSKSYNAVWDHTLKVQRIEPSNVGDILGQEKYRQVNDDVTGAFGVIRALIDGVGNPTKAGAELAVKAVIEEIHYARKEVSRWIYREYRDVAEAMGFDRYPKVRFNNMILKDEILMMTAIQGMLDRRIISYRLGHELLGFDHDTIRSEMAEEAPLVQDGTLGIAGSPYQQSGGGNVVVQETQKTPKGTPSEGRPKNKTAKTPAPASKPKSSKPAKEQMAAALSGILDKYSAEDLYEINQYIREKLYERLEEE